MPITVELCQTSSLAAKASAWVFVGRKENLQRDEIQKLLPEGSVEVWSAMLEATKPGDKGKAVSTWLPGQPARRLVAAVLPEACSRHNCRARPHAITSLLRDNTPDTSNVAIVLALEHADDALAASCAVARAFPVFSRKQDRDDETGKETGKKKANEKVKKLHVACIAAGTEVAPSTGIEHAIEGVRLAAELVDTPTSELFTDALADRALGIAKEIGASADAIRGDALREGGFGGLWGVGKAAVHKPALVVLKHEPANAKKTVAWVGKGIVYDTGGLSLKTEGRMAGMKSDMGGAAAVLGAFTAVARSGYPHNLYAVLCLAENAIGPESTRPDDILHMYSGKTVEVNNTDAEGRLVLADGVAYALKDLKADVIVDVATLTGAQLVATGKKHAAIVSNDEVLERHAVEAGRESGDLVHPLPYCPEIFRAEFKSDVADLKNSVKDRMNAQTSCAGQFIAEHLGDDFAGRWLHIDIAGPASDDERGTGFGVALLTALFRSDRDPV